MSSNANSNNPFPFSDIQPYPLLETPPTEAQYGLLNRLVAAGESVGTWVNIPGERGPKGMHTTIMPSPGTSSEQVFGVFHFKSQEYTEELRFEKVAGPVRNRGGSNEQFNGVIKYNTSITDLEGIPQHVENGMYLWLGNQDTQSSAYPGTMYRRPSTEQTVIEDDAFPVLDAGQQGPQFIPPYSISRGGVIPHGSTIHITGNCVQDQPGPPFIASLWDKPSLAISATMGINIGEDLVPGSRQMPDWTTQKVPHCGEEVGKDGFLDPNSGRAYIHRIFVYDEFGACFPYTVQPNLKLSDANENLEIKDYDLITLDSVHDTGLQGGVLNNAMVSRYCRVARMRFRMWLERVELGEGKGTVDQLQYEQIVDFEFQFGSNGGTTLWPHIQVNTLRRKRDVDAGRY